MINPLVGYQERFNISANNRELKIRSITFDWWMKSSGNMIIDPILNQSQTLLLLVGSGVTGRFIAQPFTFTFNAPTLNACGFYITRPCHWRFESFSVTNILPFELDITNADPVNQFTHFISLIVEVEEKIIWDGPSN